MKAWVIKWPRLALCAAVCLLPVCIVIKIAEWVEEHLLDEWIQLIKAIWTITRKTK